MEFSQLRIFQAVAEEGSLTRAAERLHRVPSNLSTRLRQLEEQLGVELFLRERQRLQLSPAGKVLLDYANRLSTLHDQAVAAVQGGQPAGDFVLGTMYSTAATHLPPLLARYHQTYPAVNLQVQAAPSGDLLEGLMSHRLDAALVDGPPSLAGLDGVPLCDEVLVLITSPEHPRCTVPGMWQGGRCSPSARAAPTGCVWKPGTPTPTRPWAGSWRSSLTRACWPVSLPGQG